MAYNAIWWRNALRPMSLYVFYLPLFYAGGRSAPVLRREGMGWYNGGKGTEQMGYMQAGEVIFIKESISIL